MTSGLFWGRTHLLLALSRSLGAELVWLGWSVCVHVCVPLVLGFGVDRQDRPKTDPADA